mmetsp:Transcript_31327/g.73046  ORF Transcript_31327/g.73046 Transcript_31327/m.73046 type:complete len:294 (-) Transcript_31327:429-1310(-)
MLDLERYPTLVVEDVFKFNLSTLHTYSMAPPGTKTLASARSADLPACGVSRSTVNRKSCFELHSSSILARSLATPFTTVILSPATIAFSEQLPAHCRFHASIAPPASTWSTTKALSSAVNSKPKSAPSALRMGTVKPGVCKPGGPAPGRSGKDGDKESAKDNGVRGWAGCIGGLGAARASASDRGAGAPGAGVAGGGSGADGNGNAGTSGSFGVVIGVLLINDVGASPPGLLVVLSMLTGLMAFGVNTSVDDSVLMPESHLDGKAGRLEPFAKPVGSTGEKACPSTVSLEASP